MNNAEQSIEGQKKHQTKRVGLITIGAVLTFTLSTGAQQPPARPGGPGGLQDECHEGQSKGDPRVKMGAGMSEPTVQEQMKVLIQKLGLSGDQQAKTKIILQEMNDAVQKLMLDKTLSRQELLDKVRPWRKKADKMLREILSEDQKKKLNQYLQGSHRGMHGDLSGATTAPQPPPQTR